MSFVNDVLSNVFGDDTTTKSDTTVQGQQQTGNVDTTTNSDQNQKQTSQTGTATASNQSSTASTNSTTRNLSDQEIGAGDAVLQSLSSQFSPADLSQLAQRIQGANDTTSSALSAVFDRALGAESSLDAGSAAQLASAENQGQKSVQQQFNAAAGSAGSAFNTLTQAVGAKAQGDLSLSMAALGAQLQATNRQQATSELLSAVDALQKQSGVISTTEGAVPQLEASINATNAGAVTNLVNSLKGGVSTTNGTTTTNTSGTTESQSTTNANTAVVTNTDENKGIDLNTNTATIGNGTTTNSTTLIDLLNALKD